MTRPSVVLVAAIDDGKFAHGAQRGRALERLGCDVTTVNVVELALVIVGAWLMNGDVVCPYVLSPQQTTGPSERTAQVWAKPALTWVKRPAGGAA